MIVFINKNQPFGWFLFINMGYLLHESTSS